MATQPTVSVIIPTYNRATRIKRSIDSVLRQTFKNIEIIIIDDGSTDNTNEVVSFFKDTRIRYFYKQNAGAGAARNYGVTMSRAQYVAFQDSDDEWKPDKLEKQLNKISSQNADVCFCRMQSDYENQPLKKPTYTPQLELKSSELTLSTLLQGNFTSTQMLLMKREVANSFTFDTSMPSLEDWDLMLRIFSHCKVVFYDEILVHQHLQPDSMSVRTEKIYKAMQQIEERYAGLYDANLLSKAKFLDSTGSYIVGLHPRDAKMYYLKSMSTLFTFKTWIKYCLLLVGVVVKLHSGHIIALTRPQLLTTSATSQPKS